jgi:hypothetical protein
MGQCLGELLNPPNFAVAIGKPRPGLAARTSRTATAFWPPTKAVWRARQPRYWWTAGVGSVCAGGQTAHARAGRGAGASWRTAWGQRVPTPLAGRCAPWLDEWSFTGRAVCYRAPVAGACSFP